jgi:predicted peroxiredoxin
VAAVAGGLLGAAALGASAPALAASDQSQTGKSGNAAMKKFLIHIHTGSDNPTKAALGFLVAATALKAGHHVDVFLAGDGVLLIGDAALNTVEGKGTGKLAAHYNALAGGGVRFYVSGMSAKARGMSDSDLTGKPAEFAMPDVLVRIAADSDVALTY